MFLITDCFTTKKRNAQTAFLISAYMKWMEKDSNLRRRCQQIYSLPPLATRESIHCYGKISLALTRKDYTISVFILQAVFL